MQFAEPALWVDQTSPSRVAGAWGLLGTAQGPSGSRCTFPFTELSSTTDLESGDTMIEKQNQLLLNLDLVLSSAKMHVETLISSPPILLGHALPPSTNGVYAFSIGSEIVYVGEAAGSGGLRDRILSKHLSGDDRHALQAAFLIEYPDRKIRRSYLKESIAVRWVEVPDSLAVSVVEKLAILLLCPRLNVSVTKRTVK